MRKPDLSIVIAARNDENIIRNCLERCTWAKELVVVLAFDSSDNTKTIAQHFTHLVIPSINHLGRQRQLGIDKSNCTWILVVDTDEIITPKLQQEITYSINNKNIEGFYIPYQNYFLGHKLNFGNQKYAKLRLFQKVSGIIEDLKTHPEIIVKGKTQLLISKMDHYSFRSVSQILGKFTYYAREDVERLKKVESPELFKCLIYPLHMFWAIFFKEKGFKDGFWGFLLSLSFMYYEGARYFCLWRSKNTTL